MGAGTPGSTPPPVLGWRFATPGGLHGGTTNIAPVSARHGVSRSLPARFVRAGIPFVSAGWSRVFFASVGKESSPRRTDVRDNDVACATLITLWATVMERRENHHVPRDDFFGSKPVFPRVFLCIGRMTAFMLPVASRIIHPGAVTP